MAIPNEIPAPKEPQKADCPSASCSASSASPENERYLWMQLEDARRDRERARAALRAIREGIANEEEHGMWDAEIIIGIIDEALNQKHTP